MYVCMFAWMYVCIYYAHWFLKQTALKQDLSTVGRPVGCMHAKAQRLDVHECLHMTMIDLFDLIQPSAPRAQHSFRTSASSEA